ncbi:RHS repeat domain-containing protein [Aquimarina spongiae]|uniref:YD repeat-containing protein n=1 Tax=Aquimarina spongiae TaxID=570521 RepID=A0A1M6L8K3_9FLAO|nr:RHS repeat domain-containing protein [Aquimarina spongiae]SHJ67515.1 YD repeat-containing protein [Aquimarina spongiae]
MRKYLLITLLLVIVQTFGQGNDSGDPTQIDYTSELVKMAKGAEAPEAAFFTKYGNIPVSLYTGTPNISIPVYEHRGRELNLPIQMVYDAQAIKVEEQASWVGLHWNLIAGGRVTRIVNGLPDDYINSDYATPFETSTRDKIRRYRDVSHTHNSVESVREYFHFLDKANQNKYEIAQDYFNISAPGLDETVVIDLENLTAVGLKNPRTKISYQKSPGNGTINSWVVTSENGTQYVFDVKEKTYRQGNDAVSTGGIIQEYVSSWLLRKIVSPTKKDTYEFGYINSGYWTQPYEAAPVSHVTNKLQLYEGGGNFSSGIGASFRPTTRLDQQFLSGIKHNGKMVVSFLHKNRLDLPLNTPSALSEIHIYRTDGINNLPSDFLKKIVMKHSYFGTTQQNPTSVPHSDIRLKLDKVLIQGRTGETYETYSFAYIDPEKLPAKNSLSQDYMGYYNGKNNRVLYPKHTTRGGDTYQGADRSVNFENTKIGLLYKMTYPTGGHTIFTYEANKIPFRDAQEYAYQDITYGSASVSGGIEPDNGDVCYHGCIDKFTGPPRIKYSIFTIPEDGEYQVDYETNGQYEAFIVGHAAAGLPEDHPFYNDKPIPFDQLIDNYTYEPRITPIWSGGANGSQRTIQLNKGTYQITVANSQSGASTSLRIFRRELRPLPINETIAIKAGVRIQKIEDYDTNGYKSGGKVYRYTQSLTSDDSSAKIIFEPQLHFFTTSPATSSSPVGVNTITTLHRVSGSSSHQPNVVYSRVYELEMNTANDSTSNGYIRHDFYTGESGIVTSQTKPYLNSFIPDYKIGKEKRSVIYSNDKLLSETENTYEDIPYYSATGLAIKIEDKNVGKHVYVYRDSSGKYRFTYLDPVQGEMRPAAQPIECYNGTGECLSQKYAPLFLKRTLISGKIGNTVKIQKTEVLDEQEVVVTNMMEYDQENSFLLKEQKVSNSNGDLNTTKFYYPEDFTESAYQSMYSANRLNEIVMAEVYNNNDLLATKKTIFKDWGFGIVLPEKIKSAKGNTPLEDRVIYHKYDTHNNPIEVSQLKGVHTIFIWGYKGQYPVAKVTNATYTGMPSEVLNIISEIKNASDKENGKADEVVLKNLFDQLRDHEYFNQSEVTTYTYDLQVGVTSITDPRGYTAQYEYDNFNRLIHIRDAEDHIVDKYYYNYIDLNASSSTDGYSELQTNFEIFPDFASSFKEANFKALIAGGSGQYQYQWEFETPEGRITTIKDRLAYYFHFQHHQAGKNIVRFKVTDKVTGKKKTITKSLMVYSVDIQFPRTVTVNNTATFTASISGGSGNYSYQWQIWGQDSHYRPTSKSFTRKMDYNHYGADKYVYCDITDNTNGHTIKVYKKITVNGARLGQSWTKTFSQVNSGYHNEEYSARGTLGSGRYKYYWTSSDGRTWSGTEFRIYMDKCRQSEYIKCRVTDLMTGLTHTYKKEFYFFPSRCNGIGIGDGDGPGDPVPEAGGGEERLQSLDPNYNKQ